MTDCACGCKVFNSTYIVYFYNRQIEKELITLERVNFEELRGYLTIKYSGENTFSGLFMKLVEEVGEEAEVLNQIDGEK